MSFEFAEPRNDKEEEKQVDQWNVLIVDDDREVHTITTMLFKGFIFGDKEINFEHAYSAEEAKEVLQNSTDLALILLDVVMEEIDSGLKLVGYIRNVLKNDAVRIVLRTGQPGVAPEEDVIRDLDINDYKSKSELSDMHLITTTITSLRSYANIMRIKEEVEKNIQQEKKLTQQARTAAMGEMMGAIIHQWKQPLGTINSIASNLKVQVALETINIDMIDDEMQKINNVISHMVETMNDFRDFFRPSKKLIYNVHEAIRSSVSLIGKTYEAQDITINTQEGHDIKTEGYPNELVQVLLIILSNARDAIDERKPEVRQIDINVAEDETKLYIEIGDYAGGIPEAIMNRIFEPYFTTKGEDDGEGIGLDMSKSIIKKVNGTLEVKNREKLGRRGACFIIGLNKI